MRFEGSTLRHASIDRIRQPIADKRLRQTPLEEPVMKTVTFAVLATALASLALPSVADARMSRHHHHYSHGRMAGHRTF